jgi:hypothetical protein
MRLVQKLYPTADQRPALDPVAHALASRTTPESNDLPVPTARKTSAIGALRMARVDVKRTKCLTL